MILEPTSSNFNEYKPVKFHDFWGPFTMSNVFYKPDPKQEKTEISKHIPFTRLSHLT